MIKHFFYSLLFICFLLNSCSSKIDRKKLVERHNPVINKADTLASLTLGNGNFAFTTDITGMQTFYNEYENGVPLGTMSNWGWHSDPNTENFERQECIKWFDFHGRKVPYSHQLSDTKRSKGASDYFRENPHRLHLGIIRLVITKQDGHEITLEDILDPSQKLDMWTGQLSSEFIVEGKKISVLTLCHQELDMIAVRIVSDLIQSNQIQIEWLFPSAVAKNTHSGINFSEQDKHRSVIVSSTKQTVQIERLLDTNRYFTNIYWNKNAVFTEVERHKFHLIPEKNSPEFEFCCLFSENQTEKLLPDFQQTLDNNKKSWLHFWESGGAVDFSACTDPRAFELERRTVLSQYLTKVQSAGDDPPAETGLTYNSWYGKFHLEMHWWHSVHFALWNRPQYLEKQMPYYQAIRDSAVSVANQQGFKGLRWPKMTDHQGMNSPSSVGSYLIWQQPHYIYYAELLYQINPQKALQEYSNLVFETAEFMADFAQYNKDKDRFELLPPLIPAQEHWSRETTVNPPFELSQWHWGLSTAIQWKMRLNQPVDPEWQKIVAKLSKPDTCHGVYLGIEGADDSYINHNNMTDHPMVLGMYGVLPYWDAIDQDILRNTFDTIMAKWDWPSTWGWDYPLVAMCAVRLGMPDKAIDALLMNVQKNTYLVNGHNFQSNRLRIYLPGNGGFLTTIAMMCAGWDGNDSDLPGFPKNGKWKVKWENLHPML